MENKLNEVVIVSALRTPIGTYKGSLKNIRSDQLGSIVIKEVLKRSKFNKNEIDEIILDGIDLISIYKRLQAFEAAIDGLPMSSIDRQFIESGFVED